MHGRDPSWLNPPYLRLKPACFNFDIRRNSGASWGLRYPKGDANYRSWAYMHKVRLDFHDRVNACISTHIAAGPLQAVDELIRSPARYGVTAKVASDT